MGNYCGWKLFAKTEWIKAHEMDLINNCNVKAATEHLLVVRPTAELVR